MLKVGDDLPGTGHGLTSGRGARPSLLPVGGFTDPMAPPAEPFDRAVKMWGLAHRGVWTYAEALREVRYIEQGLPLCDSCRLRSATINHLSDLVCGECDAGGRRWRDAVDRGWESYRDEVQP